jgi:hypothetical protein
LDWCGGRCWCSSEEELEVSTKVGDAVEHNPPIKRHQCGQDLTALDEKVGGMKSTSDEISEGDDR